MMNQRCSSWALMIICLTITLTLIPEPAGAGTIDDLAVGDLAWTQRAEGHEGTRAAAEPIDNAIRAYRKVLQAEPENLEARWKLLRAFTSKASLYLKRVHDWTCSKKAKRLPKPGNLSN